MKYAIVTGASGFIGKALTSALLAAGFSVCAVVSDVRKMQSFGSEPDLAVVQASFADYQTLHTKLPNSAEVCFHLAWAGVSTRDYHSVPTQLENCIAACSVAACCAQIKCRKLVFVGSVSQHQSILENGVIVGKKITAYGSTKQCAEDLCFLLSQKNCFSFSTALFPNVFGVGDFSSRSTNSILLQLLKQVPPKLIPADIPYDCIYIDDAVRGLIAVAEHGISGQQYYLGNRVIGTFRETVETMRNAVAPALPLTFGEVTSSAVTDYTQIDLECAYIDLGFEPSCNLFSSMKRTADWLIVNNIQSW